MKSSCAESLKLISSAHMGCYCYWKNNHYDICFSSVRLALIKRYYLHMCNSLTMVWKVAAVKSPCKRNSFWKWYKISRLAAVKLSCKWDDFSKRLEISNRFEFTVSSKSSLKNYFNIWTMRHLQTKSHI